MELLARIAEAGLFGKSGIAETPMIARIRIGKTIKTI
jgi:hypothetical protein